MDEHQKLSLMQKYDFQGYGNRLTQMLSEVCLIRDVALPKIEHENSMSRLYDAFNNIQKWYSTIDFGELEALVLDGDRADFMTLLLTRELLPKLKTAIDTFISKNRNSNYSLQKDDSAFVNLESVIGELSKADKYDSISYRRRIILLRDKLK